MRAIASGNVYVLRFGWKGRGVEVDARPQEPNKCAQKMLKTIILVVTSFVN